VEIQEFQRKLFKIGQDRGFGDMEIFYSSNKSTSVNVLDHEVKSYVITEQGGVSFRGLYHSKMGYSYTEKIDEKSIEFLVTEAMANAEIMEMDDQEELFAGVDHYATLHRYSEAVATISPEQLIESALAMENTALAASPFVKRVIQCATIRSEGETIIVNTKGLNCHSKYTNLSAGVYLMASDGKQTATGGEYDFTLQDISKLNFTEIAEIAAKEAVSKLAADSIETGNYPIIFRYDTATQLVRAFVNNLSGEVVEKGFSRLQGKLGEKIAGENVTIVDDPLMEDVPGAATFDAEGYPTRKNELIKDGNLLRFMHNLKTGKKAGSPSTGHAGKSSYSAPVSVSPHNLYLQPGAASLAEIVTSTDKGIFIVELQGTNAGINPVSGDFSLYAMGFVIEKGVLGRPIHQITVAGNLYEILHNIEAIANDLHIKDTISSPSIKVKLLTVAGK